MGKILKLPLNESTHDLEVRVPLDRTSSDSKKLTTLQSGFYRDKNTYYIALIFLLAFFVRFFGMWPGFSDHPDESVITVPAWKMIADLNPSPHYFTYGSFYFYIQAIVYLLTGVFFYIKDQVLINISSLVATFFGFDSLTKTTHFFSIRQFFSLNHLSNFYVNQLYYIGRLITVLFGSFTVFLTYKVAKLGLGTTVALFSSLILAILPLAVRDSKFITVDIPQTFFFMLAMYFLIKIMISGKFIHYILAGITLGFFFSFKYYPFLFPSLLLAHILNKKKITFIDNNFLTSLFLIPVGFLLGSPASIFEVNIFLKDTIWAISRYGVADKSVFTYHPFYFSFLFWKGLTPPIFILFLIGVISGLETNFKKVAFILSPIILVLYYFSFHTKSAYERALQPILPLISIISGIGIYKINSLLRILLERFTRIKKSLLFLLMFIFLSYPLFLIINSGYACTKPSTIKESENWIRNNIPEGSKIAFVIGTRFPGDIKYETFPIDLTKAFSLQEVSKLNVEYVILHLGYLSIYESWKDTDFFIPPKKILDNSYLHLVINEYQNQSKLLAKFEKPEGCWDHKLLIFKMEKSQPTNHYNLLWENRFNSSKTIDNWQKKDASGQTIFSFNLSQDLESGHFSWSKTLYVGPGIVSSPIQIKPSTYYRYSAIVKTNQNLSENVRDGFLKMNFYEKPTDTNPMFYSLSTRAKSQNHWEEIKGIVKSPPNSKFARLSFSILPISNEGYFDIEHIFLEEEPAPFSLSSKKIFIN